MFPATLARERGDGNLVLDIDITDLTTYLHSRRGKPRGVQYDSDESRRLHCS